MAGRPIMWTEEKKKEAISIILNEIAENGKSVRSILNGANREILPSNVTFCEWLSKDEELAKQYARATELRAEALLDEMIDIVDDKSQDVKEEEVDGVVSRTVNNEVIQRSRLRYDARKWLISKLNPKKYGDKIDVTSDNEKINTLPIFGENPLDKIKD